MKENENSELMTVGEAITCIRVDLYLDTAGARIFSSQEALYRACTKIERAIEFPIELRKFTLSLTDSIKKRMGTLKKSKTNGVPSQHECYIFTRAFEVPQDFFETRYKNREDLAIAYQRAKNHGADEHRSSVITEFRRIPLETPIPASRMKLSSTIESMMVEEPSPRPSFVVLHGRSAVGKSFLVSHWFRDYGAARFGPYAARLDCSAIAFDQIVPYLTEFLRRTNDNSDADQTLPELLKTNESNLIVLDGLRFDRTETGRPILFGHDQIVSYVPDLMRTLHPILRDSGNTSCILVVEDNRQSLTLDPFVRDLTARVNFHSHNIPHLTEEEGATFLSEISGSAVRPDRHREIARQLRGLPLALRAAGEELKHSNPLAQERYMNPAIVNSDREHTNDFELFVLGYMKRAEDDEKGERIQTLSDQEQAHPVAAARLLALMPAAIGKEQLRFLLEPGKVGRLGTNSLGSIIRSESPFIIPSEHSVDLHAMARNVLKREMNKLLDGTTTDEYATKDEIEWIHWKAAQWHLRILNPDNLSDASDSQYPVDAITVRTVADFVSHVVEQIRIKQLRGDPRLGEGSINQVSEGLIDLFRQRADQLTDVQLWSLAFQQVRKYLLEKANYSTRIFGQFEAKAHVLETLASPLKKMKFASPFLEANLQKEIGLCWMHCGRLQSALHAVDHGLKACERNLDKDGVEGGRKNFFPILSSNSAGWMKEMWSALCDLESTSTIIRIRQGRALDMIVDTVTPFIECADRLSKDMEGLTKPPDSLHVPPLERGVIRILSRFADLLLQQGRYRESKSRFEQASQLQRAVRGRDLDGEAARRYVYLLCSHEDESERNFEQARQILDANIKRCVEFGGHEGARYGSNDIIPFLVQRAYLERTLGNFQEAEESLEQVQNHSYMKRRECTFIASEEYSLERARLQIAKGTGTGTGTEELHQRLTRKSHEALAAHHMLLKAEYDILLAMIVGPDERDRILEPVITSLRGAQYHDRAKYAQKIWRTTANGE